MDASYTETLFVSEEETDLRLDKLLSLKFPSYSRTYFQSLIEQGKVLINGTSCKKREKPLPQDEIFVCFELCQQLSLMPEYIPLDILFEDEDLIIINKPAGLVVHPAPGHPSHTFANALLYHCQAASLLQTDPLRPGIVHRLDKDTTGVLIAAKNSFTHSALIRLFMERNIHKRYKAIVLGTPKITKIEAPIGRHPVKRQEMAVCYEKGREATTYLSVLKSMQEVSLLDVNLITGRTHQIRVHLKHIGHPVLGDPLYGNKTLNAKRGLTRQMLHAESISFIHPRTKQEVTVTAPLPQDMQDCLCALF